MLTRAERIQTWVKGFEQLNIKTIEITDKCWFLKRNGEKVGYILYDETAEYSDRFKFLVDL